MTEPNNIQAGERTQITPQLAAKKHAINDAIEKTKQNTNKPNPALIKFYSKILRQIIQREIRAGHIQDNLDWNKFKWIKR